MGGEADVLARKGEGRIWSGTTRPSSDRFAATFSHWEKDRGGGLTGWMTGYSG